MINIEVGFQYIVIEYRRKKASPQLCH